MSKNIHDCSVVKYIDSIADKLSDMGQRARQSANEYTDKQHWCSGQLMSWSDERAFAVAADMLRGLSRDLAPRLLGAPPHCTCKAVWKGQRVKIKEGYGYLGEGREGVAIGEPVEIDQYWIPIKWDDEEDPNWHKLSRVYDIEKIS